MPGDKGSYTPGTGYCLLRSSKGTADYYEISTPVLVLDPGIHDDELTGGAGVPVVYDSVGKDTFESSLDSLAPLGMLVSFGNASGPVAPFEPGILAAKGSLFFTRPTLMTYTAKREDLAAAAAELFDVVGSGAVEIEVNQTYPLAEAAQAHRDLEARKTTGSTVLLP